MEPNYHESIPTLPNPEQSSSVTVDAEKLQSSPEHKEASIPAESLIKASDAVSQALYATSDVVVADNSTMQASAVKADNNPAIADDVDVIEKEWVQKAKEIVAHTKEDPHEQSLQMENFKRDYMKKRYGKDIKLPEEQKGK